MNDIELVTETLTAAARKMEYDQWPSDWRARSERLHAIVHDALMLKSIHMENEDARTIEASA